MVRNHRVLEFYSGIGGMHYAFKASGHTGEILAAFDINNTANEVYRYNFCKEGRDVVVQRNIDSLPYTYFSSFAATLWLLSPPCQPYTRTGLQKGCADERAKSFLHVMDVLGNMERENMPEFLLVENVRGFETSSTRGALISRLTSLNYAYQEFLISPIQLGIPNSRLRYYLLAKKLPRAFSPALPAIDQVHNHIPRYIPERSSHTKQIKDYLEKLDASEGEKYRIKEKTLVKYGQLFAVYFFIKDVVKPSSQQSCCFTKGYYHYVEARGSIIQMNEDIDTTAFFSTDTTTSTVAAATVGADTVATSASTAASTYAILNLRYFTPSEISAILGFPRDFSFPEHISLKQRYRLLGNSISVEVVKRLIAYLLDE
ncbi:7776_t:CDS:2 [Paraglomus brasilianum]|uniref:tRNA (cytosine(38)-C(5))-methyltransferase n=1 Tax=Paraglomus brasilianum TaxID=144538 RepID=A0A9N9GGK8_9GLOM|nr:7776_t:CDS:2 [Paraglomus brasilianum]